MSVSRRDTLSGRLCCAWYSEEMSGEKIGGYDARLTKRAERHRSNQAAYESRYSEEQAAFHPEDAELAQELLSSIDKKQLADIFSRYLQKSGVPLDNANIQALQGILARPISGYEADAAYSSFMNFIALSTKSPDFLQAKECRARSEAIPPELLMKLQLSFIHEACHAFSRNRISTKDANNSETLMKHESGYVVRETRIRQPARRFGAIKDKNSSFEALNEGVTQRIAEEIFLELARRTGAGGAAEKFLSDYITDNAENLERYSIYENQVDGMCERIAEFAGTTKEAVWDAFKKGYFAKPELFAEETVELFQETFGEDFLDEYAKLNNKTPERMLGSFDDSAGFSRPQDYAQKWLDRLGIKRA